MFSAFLGAKKHFFQKVLKKWSRFQKKKKIENIFITSLTSAYKYKKVKAPMALKAIRKALKLIYKGTKSRVAVN